MEFNNRLYQLRKQKGLSQEELASRLNVSRQTVSKWEIGDSAPDMEKLIAMSELFDVSLDYLMLGKEDSSQPTPSAGSDFVTTMHEKVLTPQNKKRAKSALKIAGIIAGAERENQTVVDIGRAGRLGGGGCVIFFSGIIRRDFKQGDVSALTAEAYCLNAKRSKDMNARGGKSLRRKRRIREGKLKHDVRSAQNRTFGARVFVKQGKLSALSVISAHNTHNAVVAHAVKNIYLPLVPRVKRIVFANNSRSAHNALLDSFIYKKVYHFCFAVSSISFESISQKNCPKFKKTLDKT